MRRDAVFISSILFTLCFASQIPHNLSYASTWSDRFFPSRATVENQLSPIGFASLTIAVIGIIVIWTGYVRKIRWTWFVMFVIVWLFAFPIYAIPILLDFHVGAVDSSLIWSAVREPGPARWVFAGPLNFVVMLIALLLPVRAFFGKQ
jgi:hypothetical protein